MASAMKEWPVNGNYVPQPKPKYAPAGYHRCDECNALVKDGDECKCKEECDDSTAC